METGKLQQRIGIEGAVLVLLHQFFPQQHRTIRFVSPQGGHSAPVERHIDQTAAGETAAVLVIRIPGLFELILLIQDVPAAIQRLFAQGTGGIPVGQTRIGLHCIHRPAHYMQ